MSFNTQPPAPSISQVRPRADAADAFESNPAAAVQTRIEDALLSGMSDADRVKEAVREVMSGGRINTAARQWQVAPSSLAEWRTKYMKLLELGGTSNSLAFETFRGNTDHIHIPAIAREQFQKNWDQLMEFTQSNPATFYQSPWQLFLENSWLTGWLFEEGKLDRGAFYGFGIAVAALLLTGSFLFAGRDRDTRVLDKYTQPDPEGFTESLVAAEGVAQRFFKASTLAEKMAFLRINDTVRPLVEEYFHLNPPSAITDAALTLTTSSRSTVSMEFDLPSENRSHRLNVVDRGGLLLIDWESSSFCQEMQFRKLLSDKPKTPTRLNAKIQRADYWTFGFTADKYDCFLMSYPGLILDIYGYAEKESPVASRLLTRLGIRENEPAVVSVRFPDMPAGANQVLILDLIHDEWLREQ